MYNNCMNLSFKNINKILIASILFMQLSGAFAEHIFHNKVNFINLCTQNGILKIPVVEQGNAKDEYNAAKVMICCLDIQSNFVFFKTNNIFYEGILISLLADHKIHLQKLNNYNYTFVRAPPNFT